MKINKKGIPLSGAFGAVLAVVLIALLVIISLVLLTSINTTLDTDNTAATVVNESLARATTEGITLTTGASAKNGVCGAVTEIWNATNVVIGVGNVTQATNCVVTNTTNLASYGTTLTYSYPYTYSAETAASNATNTSITQFAGYPALIGLVGTIIFMGIIIGVLVMSFVFGNKNKA